MIIGFIIWSLTSALFLGVGVSTWSSKEPAGFFTGVRPPKVKNINKYNHSVAMLWMVYALLLEILGIPFLFLKQNSSGLIFTVVGVPVITIALCIAYLQIEKKYRLL